MCETVDFPGLSAFPVLLQHLLKPEIRIAPFRFCQLEQALDAIRISGQSAARPSGAEPSVLDS